MKGIKTRKKFYPLVKLILVIDKLFSGEKIIIINDAHRKNIGVPTIYACTHIGGNDIQRTLEVIHDSAYLMLSNPKILYKKAIYLGLKLNGVIPLESEDRTDKKIAYARAKELLMSGGNLLIYPEAAWNVSPNQIVMKTFTGTVRLAQETGAEIVPIAMEQYGKTFYINIGENYRISPNATDDVDTLNSIFTRKVSHLKVGNHGGTCGIPPYRHTLQLFEGIPSGDYRKMQLRLWRISGGCT